MRIIRGYQAALAAVAERGTLEEASLPAGMAQRLQELFGAPITPAAAVDRILADVRTRGDEALREYGQRIDGAALEELEVSPEEFAAARRSVDREVLEALEVAASRIRAFHEAHLARTWIDFELGTGQLVRPLERVGLYVPGGRAAYPSTVLMTAVPARVAGVGEVIAVTPPDREGNASPLVLAAAEIAGVDRVFKSGGAQAIGALAYGTATVPRVDKICGPGNLFVVLAKRAVFGRVGIDGLHGPSEAVILADGTADPVLCAADMLAQAEHDELATAVFITDSVSLLNSVQREMEEQLQGLERAGMIRSALQNNGMLISVEDLEEGLDLANRLAPEHLSVMAAEPWSLLPRVRHCGAVFLGAASSAALGDYMAGPSHVMPTAATARFTSPLRTEDFLKVTSIIAVGAEETLALTPPAAAIARAEGLTAHARALELRARLRKPEAVRDGG